MEAITPRSSMHFYLNSHTGVPSLTRYLGWAAQRPHFSPSWRRQYLPDRRLL